MRQLRPSRPPRHFGTRKARPNALLKVSGRCGALLDWHPWQRSDFYSVFVARGGVSASVTGYPTLPDCLHWAVELESVRAVASAGAGSTFCLAPAQATRTDWAERSPDRQHTQRGGNPCGSDIPTGLVPSGFFARLVGVSHITNSRPCRTVKKETKDDNGNI